MRPVFIAAFLFCSVNVFGQDTAKVQKDTAKSSEKIVTFVEEMPQFPGGDEGLLRYIEKTSKYPLDIKNDKATGMVITTFIITKAGAVENVKIIKSVSPEFDEEALRIIRMMPEWKPGKYKGKTVDVQYNVPIKFKL